MEDELADMAQKLVLMMETKNKEKKLHLEKLEEDLKKREALLEKALACREDHIVLDVGGTLFKISEHMLMDKARGNQPRPFQIEIFLFVFVRYGFLSGAGQQGVQKGRGPHLS